MRILLNTNVLLRMVSPGHPMHVEAVSAVQRIRAAGKEVVALMRKHKITIESLAFRIGTSMKRIRKIRESGLQVLWQFAIEFKP